MPSIFRFLIHTFVIIFQLKNLHIILAESAVSCLNYIFQFMFPIIIPVGNPFSNSHSFQMSSRCCFPVIFALSTCAHACMHACMRVHLCVLCVCVSIPQMLTPQKNLTRKHNLQYYRNRHNPCTYIMHTGAVNAISCESRVACTYETAGRVPACSIIQLAIISFKYTLIDIKQMNKLEP